MLLSPEISIWYLSVTGVGYMLSYFVIVVASSDEQLVNIAIEAISVISFFIISFV
jgi:lipid-A-disaccharide synthase-like uncharacterized protein